MRILLTLSLCACLALITHAQTTESKAADAYMISRMAEKFHIRPRPLDKTMSAAIHAQVLKSLDARRLFFTKGDIAQLSPYQFRLDEEIAGQKTGYLDLVTRLYQQRLTQVDTMLDRIAGQPFVFTGPDKITISEDTSYPADLPALRNKFYKILKWSVVSRLADHIADRGGKADKKYIDSLEPVLRRSAIATTRRSILRLLQSPTGIGNMIGIVYCQALAECYDPHTAYFSPDEKARFESFLGNKPLSFGFSLSEDEQGHALVDNIEPGGPAFQSGAFSEGDRITAVRWEGKDPIDVSEASAGELARILGTEGGDRLTFDIKKKDGTTREVSLQKQQLSPVTVDEDEGRVKGFLLKGRQTIGYISLPTFYEDWENRKGVNGCANDVAKEIIKMKKENIAGLVLDLRYNGGGSMQEAVDLAGLFIDAGPVGQVRSRDVKTQTLKDVNRGTVWDGPLLVLVNGSSASASEMVAGTLQDYNRALIAGSPTFGKATAQVVLPLDTTIDLTRRQRETSGTAYIKITVSRLYRINGSSAQFSGVKPDILLPDPPEASTRRESEMPFALPPDNIDANKYYHPLPALPVADEQSIAARAISASHYFSEAKQHEAEQHAAGQHDAEQQRAEQRQGTGQMVTGDRSLNLNDLVQEKMKNPTGSTTAESGPKNPTPEAANSHFTVANLAYEIQRLQANAEMGRINEDRKNDVLNDPYIGIAYQLVEGMIK
jgi:carboxyl-terminal processing protease